MSGYLIFTLQIVSTNITYLRKLSQMKTPSDNQGGNFSMWSYKRDPNEMKAFYLDNEVSGWAEHLAKLHYITITLCKSFVNICLTLHKPYDIIEVLT